MAEQFSRNSELKGQGRDKISILARGCTRANEGACVCPDVEAKSEESAVENLEVRCRGAAEADREVISWALAIAITLNLLT